MYSDIIDSFTFALKSFVVSLLIVYIIKSYLNNKKLPNGPFGIPIFGYYFFLSSKPHLDITELSKKYGNVFSLKLGQTNVVFLNDWESVKDALNKDEFLGRPKEMLATNLFQYERNLLFESGPFWKEHRRFAFRMFRDLGFGKQIMESNIKDEISYFTKEIDKNIDQPICLHDILTPSVSNNICYLVFGRRYDYDDPTRQHMDNLLAQAPRSVQPTTAIGLLPLILPFIRLFGSSKIKQMLKDLHNFENMIVEEINRHEKNIQDDDAKDYIEGYLIERNSRIAKNDEGSFTKDVLCSNSRIFFGAGSETVRTTLDWLFKIIAVRQDIQKAVQKEIDFVIGTDRLPSWSDRDLMPLTQAVILETQRWASVVTFNVPRSAVVDTTILGHFIPKDTIVIANFWAINHDPKTWKNPDEFNPYRFLAEDGKLINAESLIPFSIGKRACVGESMAKFELFLYFTTLLQKYNIEVPAGVKQNFEARLGITLHLVQDPVLQFKKR